MKLGDLGRCCSARRKCSCASPVASMGALLYHSYGDVAAEKIRVNALVNDLTNCWNGCSSNATDATGQALSNDINGFFTSWSSFANTGAENYADFPDNDEWDTMQSYEQTLQTLTARLNSYCGCGLLGPAPSGKSPTSPVAMLTAAVVTIAIAIVAIEVAPLLTMGVDALTD